MNSDVDGTGPVSPPFAVAEIRDWRARQFATSERERRALLKIDTLLGLSEGQHRNLNDYAAESHADNAKWWERPDGSRIERNKGELLMLIVSEVSEAMEGERKDLMDDKLPHRRMAEVELADALIRIFDYAQAFGYDLEGAYREKRAFNASREDHTFEARARAGGKKW